MRIILLPKSLFKKPNMNKFFKKGMHVRTFVFDFKSNVFYFIFIFKYTRKSSELLNQSKLFFSFSLYNVVCLFTVLYIYCTQFTTKLGFSYYYIIGHGNSFGPGLSKVTRSISVHSRNKKHYFAKICCCDICIFICILYIYIYIYIHY